MTSAPLSMSGALSAQGAESPRTSCLLDPATHVLTVELEAARGGRSEAWIRRSGDSIEVSERLRRSKVACVGRPTVSNTERVELLFNGVTAAATRAGIDLDGGPFAPGLTPEADGSSEIEFVAPEGGNVVVDAGRGPDHLQYLSAGELTGLNLNPAAGDRDVDVGIPGTIQNLLPIHALGGAGPDRIETVGRVRAAVSADGGSGNDIMLASGAGIAVLAGQGGNDRIVGTSEYDVLSPGDGRDTVEGLGDEDVVRLEPDGQPDAIDCGGGEDEAGSPDRFDRLRSCERIGAPGAT